MTKWDYSKRGPRALYDKSFDVKPKPSKALDDAEEKIRKMKIPTPKYNGKTKLTDETIIESGYEMIPLKSRLSSGPIHTALEKSRVDFARNKLQQYGHNYKDKSRRGLELRNHFQMLSYFAHRALDRHDDKDKQFSYVHSSMIGSGCGVPGSKDINDALDHAKNSRTDITLRKEEMSLVERVKRLDEIFGLFGKKKQGRRDNITSSELTRHYNKGFSDARQGLPRFPPTTAHPDMIDKYNIGYDMYKNKNDK